jgi:hypothetical protein
MGNREGGGRVDYQTGQDVGTEGLQASEAARNPIQSDLDATFAQRIHDATSVYPAGATDRGVRAARALSRLAAAAVDPNQELSAGLVSTLETLADTLGRARSRFTLVANNTAGVSTFPMGTHPIVGRGNPIAPPIAVELVDNVVVGRVCYGALHEGLPGSVFGGSIAAGFDALLGIRAALVGTPCSAVQLSTRFHKPTPLHVELRYEAELEGVDNRKIRTRGRLYDEHGNLTAECEALFLAVATEAVTSELVPAATISNDLAR